jgi:HTH-type transcriptional regulator/antitoxin HigA
MKLIKTEADYEIALDRAEELIEQDPVPGTQQADELEVLVLLINKFEDEHYPIDLPDPIEAVKFRMEQQELKNSDMIPYFGSKSKVSEVLNRKRPLSLAMIRRLHNGLGIPAEVLIKSTKKEYLDECSEIDWTLFPLTEMIKMDWIDFKGSAQSAKEYSEELIREYFDKACFDMKECIFYRKSCRGEKKSDTYALAVWHAKAMIEEQKFQISTKFNFECLTNEFFVDLRKLSIFEKGPILAQEFLLNFGIKLVIVPHLKKTYLDGAVFYNKNNTPVIAMTIRYDRIDNFWFTLFHELAHLKLHFANKEDISFFDDLQAIKNLDASEIEADQFSEEKLIDKESWNNFYKNEPSENDILEFSKKYRISPAIVAGRIRKKTGEYKKYRNIVGYKKVKNLFI